MGCGTLDLDDALAHVLRAPCRLADVARDLLRGCLLLFDGGGDACRDLVHLFDNETDVTDGVDRTLRRLLDLMDMGADVLGRVRLGLRAPSPRRPPPQSPALRRSELRDNGLIDQEGRWTVRGSQERCGSEEPQRRSAVPALCRSSGDRRVSPDRRLRRPLVDYARNDAAWNRPDHLHRALRCRLGS
jgi:hypothetical protein